MELENGALTMVARLWSEVLAQPEVGPQDDFFKLGGDSLTAVTLTAHVNETFQLDLDPIEVFERSVLEDYAAFVDASRSPP